MSRAAPLAEPNYPVPPRYRQTKRIVCVGMVYFLALAGLWLWWSQRATRRFEAEVAAVRARGDPLQMFDLERPAVPDERNAAFYLREAAKAMDPTTVTAYSSNLQTPLTLPLPPEWRAIMESSVEANQRSLQLIRRAQSCDQIDWWGITPASSAMAIATSAMSDLQPQRKLADLLYDAALLAHATGDDAATVEYLLDLFFLADAVGEQRFLVSHLTQIGLQALASSAVQLVAPELGLPEGHAAGSSPATRQQVERLIRELLQEDRRSDSARRALRTEQVLVVDLTMQMVESEVLLKPMMLTEVIWTLRVHQRLISAAGQPTWPQAHTELYRPPDDRDRMGLLMEIMIPSIVRAVRQGYWTETDLKMSAVALAVRLYQIDHQGQYPATLEDLVPHYLPEVPVDPLSEGKPLGYVILDGPRPLVYSVGTDGVDDTLAGARPTDQPQQGWQRTRDEWRDLSHWPAPATSPPADDDHEQPQ